MAQNLPLQPSPSPSPHTSVHLRLGPRLPPPLHGAIFICNRRTMNECLQHRLFGLPISKKPLVDRIVPGMKLFLFEFERRELWGIFEATSYGGLNIAPDAYTGGSFPCQVRVQTLGDCVSLKEEEFREAITENYFEKNKFHLQLSHDQVSHLCSSFMRKYSNVINLVMRDLHGENLFQEVEPYIASRYNLGLDAPLLMTDDVTHSFPKDLVGVPMLPYPKHLELPQREAIMSDGIYADTAKLDDCCGKAGFIGCSAESVIPFQAGVLSYAYSNPHHLINNDEYRGDTGICRLLEKHDVEMNLISDSKSSVSNSRSVWSRISTCPNPTMEPSSSKMKEGQFMSSDSLSHSKVPTTIYGTQGGLRKEKPSANSSMHVNRKERPANVYPKMEAVEGTSVSATPPLHDYSQKRNVIDHDVDSGDDHVEIETSVADEFLVRFKRRRKSNNNATSTIDQPSTKRRRKLARPSFGSSEVSTTKSLDLHEDPMQKIAMAADDSSLCHLETGVTDKIETPAQNPFSSRLLTVLDVTNGGHNILAKCEDSFQSESFAMGDQSSEPSGTNNKTNLIVTATLQSVEEIRDSAGDHLSSAKVSFNEDFIQNYRETKSCGSSGPKITNENRIDKLERQGSALYEKMDNSGLCFRTGRMGSTDSIQMCRQLGLEKHSSHTEMQPESQPLSNAVVGTEYVSTQLVLGLPTHDKHKKPDCSDITRPNSWENGLNASGNSQTDRGTVSTLLALGQTAECNTEIQQKSQDPADLGTGEIASQVLKDINGVYGNERTEARHTPSMHAAGFVCTNSAIGNSQPCASGHNNGNPAIVEVGVSRKELNKGDMHHDMPISLMVENTTQSSNLNLILSESASLDVLHNQPQLSTANNQLSNQIDLKSILQNGSQISSIKLQLGPEPCLILKLGDSLISSINNNSNLQNDIPRKQPTMQLQ